FYVNKVFGDKKIGSATDPQNPFASLVIKLSDGKSSQTVTKATNVVLSKEGDFAVIEVDYTPSTSYIEATWELHNKHRTLLQSTDWSNDGPYTKDWSSQLNI